VNQGIKQNALILLMALGSDADAGLPIVKVDAANGREDLWRKVRLAFLHIHEHFGEDYDWFMKADDDTFDFICF
jgi:glycoprotein-N-acetylgalactosamine 3-beta-galactosyltransferase